MIFRRAVTLTLSGARRAAGGNAEVEWLWYFLLYSFLGFLLEAAYAGWRGGDPDRTCLLVFPLCPVYGLGVCAVLLLPEAVLRTPPLLVLAGGGAAAAVEYAAALFYQKALAVSFWDYRGLPGNLHGRVCLPFTLAWGALLLPAVYLIHPAAVRLASAIPQPVSWAVLAALSADLALSALALRRTGDIRCLQWYRSARAADRRKRA